MAKRFNVAICDDESSNRDKWKDELGKIPGFSDSFEVELIVADEKDGNFRKAIDGLGERKKQARSTTSTKAGAENLFDKIDLLIVDYDLINAAHGNWITGEEIAYLARCYSSCKVIVAVNQYGSNPFDLNLTGHFPESFADINLGDKQVSNPGLWTKNWPNGFRPWYWPMLPNLINDIAIRVKDVSGENLDRPVKEVLGFRDDAWRLLPRETIAKITPRGSNKVSEQITIRDVIENSELGLRHKDELMDDEAAARIAGARLGQWLDYAVLAAQDILVDAPHLVERYPSLTGKSDPTIDQLNTFARIDSPDVLGLDKNLAELAFGKSHWLSRPAWYWPSVTQAKWIKEVLDPWGTIAPNAYFCEDVSRFVAIDQTREFRIRVPSVYDTRHCINPNSKGAEGWTAELNVVDYQPNGRLMD